MAEIQWIKIVTDMFDNRKIRQLEKMPDGDAIIVIWFKLLCLAGQTNDHGLVYLTREVAYTPEMLADHFNRPLNTVKMALVTFERFGMIETINDIIMLPSWEKYQNIEGMDKVREKARKRVAAYRERQKALALPSGNATCNVTVTDGNAIDKDKEIDIDKDLDKEDTTGAPAPISPPEPKPKKKAKVDTEEIFSRYTQDEKTLGLLREWLKVRKAKRAPETEKALTLNLDKLHTLAAESGMNDADYLEGVIARGWAAFYPLESGWKRQAAPDRSRVKTEAEHAAGGHQSGFGW